MGGHATQGNFHIADGFDCFRLMKRDNCGMSSRGDVS
jgi:hypothetical protein